MDICEAESKEVESKGNELVYKNEVISTELRQHEEVGRSKVENLVELRLP